MRKRKRVPFSSLRDARFGAKIGGERKGGGEKKYETEIIRARVSSILRVPVKISTNSRNSATSHNVETARRNRLQRTSGYTRKAAPVTVAPVIVTDPWHVGITRDSSAFRRCVTFYCQRTACVVVDRSWIVDRPVSRCPLTR